MIVGRIYKAPEPGAPPWAVEAESIGGWTQGRTRKEAFAMLVDLVELKLESELKRPDVKVCVTVLDEDGPDSFRVLIEATEPALLGALVLRHQRQVRGMTVQEVATKLGAIHHNAYASYEQGKREPSVGKFTKLLAAVAPEMMLTIVSRQPTMRAARRARRKRSRSSSGPQRT